MQRLESDKKFENSTSEIFVIVMIFLLLLILFFLAFIPISNAYYGISGLGLYGSGIYGASGIYGSGIYGISGLSGLYGSSIYGISGLGGLYGMGMYGLYGGAGGLYGLYGLSGICGLYGMSGLYGLGGLGGFYGLGGMYGLGGLGGFYGLGGLGGIYGLGGLYGSSYGLGGMLGSMGLLSSLGLANLNPQTQVQSAPVVAAEQAGTWTGSWFSLLQLKGGFMNMTLVEDTLAGILSGEVNLILNKITNSIPANVTGVLPAGVGAGTSFVLSGGNQGIFSTTFILLPSAISIYAIELTCNMTSPVTMTGTYQIQDLLKLNVDYGNFNLTLTTPVI
ncbi:MAG: hypothetical protein ACMUIM_03130 [bacterium]